MTRCSSEHKMRLPPRLTTRCAWCGRYKVEDGWVVIERSRMIREDTTSHGICEDCVAALREKGLSV